MNGKTRCNRQRVRSTCGAENIQTTPRLFYRRYIAALEIQQTNPP